MPEAEQPVKPEQTASELMPAFADPLSSMRLDTIYTREELVSELESISEEPVIEGNA